jgi:hypothetical protein
VEEAVEAGKILSFKEERTIRRQLIVGAWDLNFISPNLSRCLHPSISHEKRQSNF